MVPLQHGNCTRGVITRNPWKHHPTLYLHTLKHQLVAFFFLQFSFFFFKQLPRCQNPTGLHQNNNMQKSMMTQIASSKAKHGSSNFVLSIYTFPFANSEAGESAILRLPPPAMLELQCVFSVIDAWRRGRGLQGNSQGQASFSLTTWWPPIQSVYSITRRCDTQVFVGFVLCGRSVSVWARGSEMVWATVASDSRNNRFSFLFSVFLKSLFLLFLFCLIKETETFYISFRSDEVLEFSRSDAQIVAHISHEIRKPSTECMKYEVVPSPLLLHMHNLTRLQFFFFFNTVEQEHPAAYTQ